MNADAQVLIVGAGPSGLVLAIELGQRGIRCVVIERNAGTSTFPKANLTSARTMEHYRRLGFAREFRSLGLPMSYPQDVTFWTRYARHELCRYRVPSSQRALAMSPDERGNWMTPELPHRAQQMAFEPLLRKQAEAFPHVELKYGWEVVDFAEEGDRVTAVVEHAATGRRTEVSGAFLIGCDGPRSLVRRKLGFDYEGEGSADREFFGGRMLAMHFRSPSLYRIINGPLAWHYWTVNRQRRALLVALDGVERFVVHMQLSGGLAGTEPLAREWLNQAAGADVAVEASTVVEWTAGYTLVSNHYQRGRVFIAGDAAHLFTPAAGLGYNTSIDDIANLAWKLAAILQGWGGPALSASYERERRPVGVRNTGFAKRTADNVGSVPAPDDLEEESPAGALARRHLGMRVDEILRKEFEIPGLVLGVCYTGSPIIAEEATPAASDDPHIFMPSAAPGRRAPHVNLSDGTPIFDRFGKGFTLLCLGTATSDGRRFAEAARTAGMPVDLVHVIEPEVRDLYGSDYALVRPDQHVAWRGDRLPDAASLVARVCGWRDDGQAKIGG